MASHIPVGLMMPPRDLTSATDARTTRLRRPRLRRSSSRREPLTIVSPCDHSCAPTLPRPPHPALHVRDDRDTPLCGRGGMARTNHTFLKNRSVLFCRDIATVESALNCLAKFDFARTRFFAGARAPSRATPTNVPVGRIGGRSSQDELSYQRNPSPLRHVKRKLHRKEFAAIIGHVT